MTEIANAAAILWLASALVYLSLWMTGAEDGGREDAEDPRSAGMQSNARGDGSPRADLTAGAVRRNWRDVWED